MDATSAQFVPSRRMGLHEPLQQLNSWGDIKGKLDNETVDTSNKTTEASYKYNQEASKPVDKVRRRLAQNREAARKSRLRKKAYVQQLESSKLRLIQIEQEIERSRKQDQCIGGGGMDTDSSGLTRSTDTAGILTFEMQYGQWVEEQNKQIIELRNVLNSDVDEMELLGFVDSGMKHYINLFTMKAIAAKADVFYLISGLWKTTAEHFFFWIGGFRPSQFLKILLTTLETLEEQHRLDVGNLAQSCQQAEEALSQGMERLHRIVSEAIAAGQLGQENYNSQIGAAMEKLEALVRFVGQADHLRRETLQQIIRILTTRQAAQALLALGEYMQRLRALSSLWASRPYERRLGKYS